MNQRLAPFHLALPVNDLKAAEDFYTSLLGCTLGRTDERWIDLDFFGHQLSLHLKPDATEYADTNNVDDHAVPVRHFGVVLPWDTWHQLAESLQGKVVFIIEPYIRFEGKVGEQATMFFRDPSGNALEFKSFKDPSQLFAYS